MSLVVDGVSKAFGGLQVLDAVSFSAPTHERTGIVGPNGAGKSTLFACISGFIRLDRGAVHFESHDLTQATPVSAARWGLVRTFQVPRPYRHMTVRDNLLAAAPSQSGERLRNLFLAPRQVRREEAAIRQRAEEVLGFLRLQSLANQQASELSGGQLKLLELGRVLMTKPKLIMLDEPFAGVHPVLIEQLCTHMTSLNEQGIGCVVIEHNLGALAELVSRLIVLDRGKIIADGSPSAVLSDPNVGAAYVGRPQ